MQDMNDPDFRLELDSDVSHVITELQGALQADNAEHALAAWKAAVGKFQAIGGLLQRATTKSE